MKQTKHKVIPRRLSPCSSSKRSTCPMLLSHPTTFWLELGGRSCQVPFQIRVFYPFFLYSKRENYILAALSSKWSWTRDRIQWKYKRKEKTKATRDLINSSDMAWCHFVSLSAYADVMGSRSEFLDNEVWRFSF